MSTLNDFKLVNIKSSKYFELLLNEYTPSIPITEVKMKERFGFYLFMLENICGIKDISDLVDMVTDTEFNKYFFSENYQDHGIDAIYINEEDNEVNLFNFKFRNKFNIDKEQSVNETVISTKFVNAIINEDYSEINGKLKTKAKEIINNLNSNTIWKMNLYVVSNENKQLSKSNFDVKQLEEFYDLQVIPIGLPYIKEIMSIRPEPVDAMLMLDSDAIMSYSESTLSSSKSYIVRLPTSELIRISCKNKELRNKYDLEDISDLSTQKLDFAVLFDNVRGFVLKSKFNTNIATSLKDHSKKFFMYNNGITITAENIKSVVVNAGKKVKLTISNFQILNGGQTLRTIHDFNALDSENITKNLASSEILVRIFSVDNENDNINKIAEYTNSQNAISNIDLKSLSSEQIQLEQYLNEHNIIYARKSGDIGLENKAYEHKISMERFGQILFAINGNPEKSSNQKKQIFDKYYHSLFGDESLNIQDAPNIIKRHFEIKNLYEHNDNKFTSSDQKIFYIQYMDTILTEWSLDDQIKLLENTLVNFPTEKTVSDARKLIQTKFKTFLDENIKFASSNEEEVIQIELELTNSMIHSGLQEHQISN